MDGGKDNRMRGKRSKMNQYNRRKAHAVATTSSSSAAAKVEQLPPRSVIDLANSSDERCQRRSWGGKTVAPQRHIPGDIIDERDDLELAGNAQMHAGDFDEMSQLPAAAGGHFLFASERAWEDIDDANEDAALERSEASEYFTLNLKLLNVGLQTIPFHKRLDYAASLFTREQLDAMEQAAEEADKTYQNVLREHQSNPKIKINSGSRGSASAKSQPEPPKTPLVVAQAEAAADDELDELLSLTTAQVASVGLDAGANSENVAPAAPVAAPAAANGGGQDDIQQWLDNVLEE